MEGNDAIFALILAAIALFFLARWGWMAFLRYAQRQASTNATNAVERQRQEINNRPFNPADIPASLKQVSLMLYGEIYRDDTSVRVWLFPENRPHKDYIGMSGDGAYNAHENAIWYYYGVDYLDQTSREGILAEGRRRFDDVLSQLEATNWHVVNRLHDGQMSRLYHLERG